MRRPVFLAALLSTWFGAVVASAADPAPPASTEEDEPQETERAPTPPATDLLAWHPLLGVAGKLAVPFGKLDSERSFGDSAGLGYGVAGDLGLGLSRSVELGVWADYVTYDSDEDCAGCEITSFGVGPFLRYHLVQGMRFDPFLTIGGGHRALTISRDGQKHTDSGLAWLKLGLGGNWYALSQVAFGPYAELELSTLTEPPEGSDPAVFAHFSTGLRLHFDVRGR
ncbi:MAG: hypothetical protein M3020_07270 [Myxococcota bacterium]|nr:hypothetical protein [Myxococcota bacterium]